jgi:hypothetical protein
MAPDVHFMLLSDERTMQHAANVFGLFSDDCRPRLDPCSGIRYAVVADSEKTFLMVLCHSPPYRDTAVTVSALVVSDASALPRLAKWLANFANTHRRFMRTLHIGGEHTRVLHLCQGVTTSSIARALRSTSFR